MRKIADWQAGCVIFVCIVAAGILLDSWPRYHDCREAAAMIPVKEKTLLLLQSREHVAAAAIPLIRHTPSSLLQLITGIGHDSGIHLMSFRHAPIEAGRGFFRDHAACTFSGTYQQVVVTMLALADAANGLLLRDFTLQLSDQGDYLLNVDVFLTHAESRRQVKEQINKLDNPFCAGDDGRPMNQAEDAAALRSDTVGTMQMLAYLRQGTETVAWLRLSSGHLVQIQRGEIIGAEQAVVEAVDQTGVSLMSAAGRRYHIRRAGERQ